MEAKEAEEPGHDRAGGGCWPGCWTRMNSSHPAAFTRYRANTRSTRWCCSRADRSTDWTTSRASPNQTSSGATPTGGAHLDAGQVSHRPRPGAVPRLLRRGPSGRMPNRLWPHDEPAAGRTGSGTTAGVHRLSGRERQTRRVRLPRAVQHRSQLAGPDLFHEYFHGDTGRGCGASHQTGWTGLMTQILIDQCLCTS